MSDRSTRPAGDLRDIDFRRTSKQPVILVHEKVKRGISGVFMEDTGWHALLIQPEQRNGIGPNQVPQGTANRRRKQRDPNAGPTEQIEFMPFSLPITHGSPRTTHPLPLRFGPATSAYDGNDARIYSQKSAKLLLGGKLAIGGAMGVRS